MERPRAVGELNETKFMMSIFMKKRQGYRVALLFIVMAWLPVMLFAGERSLDTSNLPSIGLPSQPDDSVAKARDEQEKARLKKERDEAKARAEVERKKNEETAAELKAAKEESARLKKKMETAVPAPSIKLQASGVPMSGAIFTDSITGMEFVYVKGGCYQMGDTFGDGGVAETPVHTVCVSDYWLGKYEVTQGEWEKVMGNNPSYFKKGTRYPVEQVSWDDAQEFIKKLNKQSGKQYRLPTEAEWEYAAREGGKKVRFGTGRDTIGADEANFDAHSLLGKESYSRIGEWRRSTVVVGNFAPNGLGLYDMSGNVWEWCSDWYDKNYYANSPRNNPQGSSSGADRVIRGGDMFVAPMDVRAANRNLCPPDSSGAVLSGNVRGFRLALPSDQGAGRL